MKSLKLQNNNLWFKAQFSLYFLLLIAALIYGVGSLKSTEIKRDEKDLAIENALYTKVEFFGAKTIVPFPTANARENLAQVLTQFPDDAKILLKLAELDEKLGDFERAEIEIKQAENLDALASFYERRGRFTDVAEILEKILQNSTPENRGFAFTNLINFAKKHDLQKYLAPEFYQQIIAQDTENLAVLYQFIENLIEEKNYWEALKIINDSKQNFPQAKDHLLKKEVLILTAQGKINEAENVYHQSFNAFATKVDNQDFFNFLDTNNRLRSYENKLKQNFKNDSSSFENAMRLVQFEDGENVIEIIQRLENARAKKQIKWSTEELLTVSNHLINSGDGAEASRFLYALCTNFRLENGSDLRRKILYQLFELLSDAGTERLPLTKGDLKFYENIAKSDVNPGITTGILSLIFADTFPREKFENKEITAIKLFNRAAAFRIFTEFKTEYADAPELAQMYLDLIRLYTNTKELSIASKILEEFEQKFPDFKDFPDAALKLADAYIAAGNYEKEREIYQKLLDFIGKTEQQKFPAGNIQNEYLETEPTQTKPQFSKFPTDSNAGIGFNNSNQKPNDYYYYRENPYKNYLLRETPQIFYSTVLERFVGSLARDNKTAEILQLYANETAKYPSEQRLYEQMLNWLGQTNLTEKQFEYYQKALQNFPKKTWQNRFARWLIRQKRQEDFENYSRALLENFDDAETQDYFKEFVDSGEFSKPESFDNRFYFSLYKLAHERFPSNLAFTNGLLRYYKANNMEAERCEILAENFFISPELRREFLEDLAKNNSLREFLAKTENFDETDEIKLIPYKLFRAEASVWLADFENSVADFRELNRLYPNTAEFSESFIALTRSFGQKNREMLGETADWTQTQSENFPANALYRIRAGEVQAELGNYENARKNWEKLIAQAAGDKENYLETATIYWDYFQFDDALRTIQNLRAKTNDNNLYAFETGAIFEATNDWNAAIDEYLKAISQDENPEKYRAKERLKQLFQKPDFPTKIYDAFNKKLIQNKDNFRLVFNFSDVLFQLKKPQDAINLLKNYLPKENNRENLLEAKRFFRDLEDTEAIRFALNRLVQTARNSRDEISFRFQLADSYNDAGETERVAAILAELVIKFPKNYGVLRETENFYWEIGKRETAIEILQNARKIARGEYGYRINRQLAERLIYLNRFVQAETILLKIFKLSPNDKQVFNELADIYVKTNRPDVLRKVFAETIAALKKQNLEPREFRWQAEPLQKQMISAFTRLKDYNSATEQYIELINREPENEELLEETISYAKRYGGADNLLIYYKKVSAEAFKNYRWNVVLARIYEAKNDFENAAENYRVAIYNQPEMLELYESLNKIYLKMENYDSALKTLNKMLELSNEDQKYVKQKIKTLEKLGRKTELEAEKQKLMPEELPKPQTLQEKFAEAENLKNTEIEKAAEKYREAFENLLQNPIQNDLRGDEIKGFVETLHKQTKLSEITEKLWILREKLIAEIEKTDSLNTTKTRKNLEILEGAMLDSISKEIKLNATGNDIFALREDIENRLKTVSDNRNRTLSLLQNLISRCGFEDLQERILIARLNEQSSEKHAENMRNLVNFYQLRGNFPRVLEILENETANVEFLKIYAETARILGNREKEFSALQKYFDLTKQNGVSNDSFINRYLELMYENNKAELTNLAQNSSRYQLQIINFLLKKKEFESAKTAIQNSVFSGIWKNSRIAEISLKSKNFNNSEQIYFTNNLQIAPIGELISQNPTAENQFLGKDWFNFAEKYGEWLFAAQNAESERFLPAMIESKPKDFAPQFDLGILYLKQKNFPKAFEHLHLANELNRSNKTILPYLGAAYFQLGETEKASETWRKIIEDEEISFENAELYLETLADFGQAEKGRNDLREFFVKKLREFDDAYDTEKKSEDLVRFIRKLAESFSDENQKSAFFTKICEDLSENTLVAETLLKEDLVGEKSNPIFYEILINRAEEIGEYQHDYGFVSILETSWDTDEAEMLVDAEKDFEIDELTNEKISWQKEYLEFLFKQDDFPAVENLVAEIEKEIKGHYARPVWLRLAKFKILAKSGKSAELFGLMKKFVGIEISANSKQAVLPNLSRFNEARKILEIENQNALILDLEEAFYARLLAFEQFDSANFIALADVEFKKNNPDTARKILDLMIKTSAIENVEESIAQLSQMSLIERFTDKESTFKIPAVNSMQQTDCLKLAAETFEKFGFFNDSITLREQLSIIAPENFGNKIELAKLSAKNENVEKARKILLEIIVNRNAERIWRWQSLIVLGEIIGKNAEIWQRIQDENQNLADAEMNNALEAIRLFKTEQTGAGLEILNQTEKTPQVIFLTAVFEKNLGQTENALQSFSQVTTFENELNETFGFWEISPKFQVVELYLKLDQKQAAIESANLFEVGKMNTYNDLTKKARLEILETLSVAAEEIGDLANALEFETARFDALENESEKEVSAKRVEFLKSKIEEQNKLAANNFSIE